MDLNVVVKFDKRADELISSLIEVLSNGGRGQIYEPEQPKAKQSVKKVEEVSDIDMLTVEGKEIATSEKVVDYAALKKEAKSLGIQLVQMKKKEEVQKLTEKYGYKKISDVDDKDIEAYLADLKAIREA